MLLSVSEGSDWRQWDESVYRPLKTAAILDFSFSLGRFTKHHARDIKNIRVMWSKGLCPLGSCSVSYLLAWALHWFTMPSGWVTLAKAGPSKVIAVKGNLEVLI